MIVTKPKPKPKPRPPADPHRERDVLALYVRGKSTQEISLATGASDVEVLRVIEHVARWNRQYARTLVHAFDEGLINARRIKTEPPAPPAPQRVRHPIQEKTVDTPPTGSIEELLATAERSGIARLSKEAANIRAKVSNLSRLVADTAEQRRLEQEVAELRAKLDDKNAELRKARTLRPALSGRPAKPAPVEATPAVIRLWARSVEMPCNPHGRVPVNVVAAYHAAHPDGGDA